MLWGRSVRNAAMEIERSCPPQTFMIRTLPGEVVREFFSSNCFALAGIIFSTCGWFYCLRDKTLFYRVGHEATDHPAELLAVVFVC
jgi:hypothetical protein